MKTVSQLGSGIQPVGTTSYMGRAEHLMQCSSNVERGNLFFTECGLMLSSYCALKTRR